MTISNKITGFVLGDQNDLKLFSLTGEIIFDYNSSSIQNEIIPKVATKIIAQKSEPEQGFIQSVLPIDTTKNESENAPNNETINKTQTLNNDLPATALLSDTLAVNSSNSYFSSITFILLLFVAIASVYFVRRKKNVINPLKNGDFDFEILDE